jgi:hypothetical protein
MRRKRGREIREGDRREGSELELYNLHGAYLLKISI